MYLTVYDIDNKFKFQALQTEGERKCSVRFCSRPLPQSIAVILHLLIFYNMRFYHLFCYMYTASNYVHHKCVSLLSTKYYWYLKNTKAKGHICLQVAG